MDVNCKLNEIVCHTNTNLTVLTGMPASGGLTCYDDFYDGIIALATILTCFGGNTSKDCSDRNPVGPLKELLGCTGLGALLIVIMILLLRSGDVEMNPGPVERGR